MNKIILASNQNLLQKFQAIIDDNRSTWQSRGQEIFQALQSKLFHILTQGNPGETIGIAIPLNYLPYSDFQAAGYQFASTEICNTLPFNIEETGCFYQSLFTDMSLTPDVLQKALIESFVSLFYNFPSYADPKLKLISSNTDFESFINKLELFRIHFTETQEINYGLFAQFLFVLASDLLLQTDCQTHPTPGSLSEMHIEIMCDQHYLLQQFTEEITTIELQQAYQEELQNILNTFRKLQAVYKLIQSKSYLQGQATEQLFTHNPNQTFDFKKSSDSLQTYCVFPDFYQNPYLSLALENFSTQNPQTSSNPQNSSETPISKLSQDYFAKYIFAELLLNLSHNLPPLRLPSSSYPTIITQICACIQTQDLDRLIINLAISRNHKQTLIDILKRDIPRSTALFYANEPEISLAIENYLQSL